MEGGVERDHRKWGGLGGGGRARSQEVGWVKGWGGGGGRGRARAQEVGWVKGWGGGG